MSIAFNKFSLWNSNLHSIFLFLVHCTTLQTYGLINLNINFHVTIKILLHLFLHMLFVIIYFCFLNFLNKKWSTFHLAALTEYGVLKTMKFCVPAINQPFKWYSAYEHIALDIKKWAQRFFLCRKAMCI